MIFDSGVGGLTVAAQIRKKVPYANITYISDNAYFPYGKKTVEQLKNRVIYILKKSVLIIQPDVIVIACNTASTIALDLLRQEIDIPIIGVVPAIKPAANLSKKEVISVVGTNITASSHYVKELITKYAAHCKVIIKSSEILVLEAEKKIAGQKVNLNNIKNEIDRILITKEAKTPDVLVLACTHFPLLSQEISNCLPDNIQIIDSGKSIANRVYEILKTTGFIELNIKLNSELLSCDYYMTEKKQLTRLCKDTVEKLLNCSVNFKVMN